MAEQQQQQEQERPGVRRRSSLGRAMERVRDALKKRRSSAQGTPTLQSTREEGAAARPAEQQQQAQPPAPAPTTTRAPKAAEPRESIADSQLEADDLVEDESNVNEEPLTTAFSSRTGISEDKTKALFERYGIKYQPRTPAAAADGDAGQTNKVRRVERPVRIRIHWTCHQCQRQFGPASACLGCGHRRCGDCARSPPKRIKAIVDEAKEDQLAQANKSQILAAVAPSAAASDPQPATTADKLDVDDANDDGNPVDISQLSMQTRPNSGIKLVMRSKPPTMRRICHECQTPFKSRSATQCEKCSHQRCDACPVRAAKMAGVAEEQPPPFEPTMVASVQRVYRKPRQRVRWQCDKCQTTIVDGHRCRECNHERCGECVRSPVKRAPYEPDPAVLQSLNDKIEAWQRQRDTATQPAPIAS